MSQEYKILSISASTNGNINDSEASYISTTAATVTFDGIIATTFYGNGSNLTGVAATFNGGTVTGSTNFTTNLSATTFSATTIASPSISGGTIYLSGTSISDTFLIKSGTTRITVGTVQPSEPSIGDLWVDTN